MKKGKSSISKARSYVEIGEFWDEHDLSDVVLEPQATYYPIPNDLSEQIQSVARKEGVPSDKLVNRWLDQKLRETRRRSGKLSAKNA
jgi:hypothetical protein